MSQEYLVPALEALEDEAAKDATAKTVHSMIEKKLYDCEDDILKGIAEKKKTISGAIGKMRDYAQKNRTGNVGVVAPNVAEKIITEYFGFQNEKKEEAESEGLSIFDIM